MKGRIEHEGIVTKIEKDIAHVKIEQTSACAGCHAKSACSAFDKAEKIIDAGIPHGTSFYCGERVMIEGKRSIGLKAVLIAFVIPFMLILISLIISLHYTNNEGISALISIGILIPYFFTIFLLRDKLQKDFRFYLKKIN